MFDKLLELVMQFGERLIPFVIIPVFQNGSVLRFGRYHRTLEPGFHWKLPLIEETYETPVCVRTVRLEPQTCTTKDRKSVVVAGVVKYRITDVRPYISEVWDQHDVLVDVSMGAILGAVRDVTFEELVDKPPEAKVASTVRRQVKDFGFEILAVTFTDIGLMRSLRLITHAPPDLVTG